MAITKNPYQIKIAGRLSYPNLFEPKGFNGATPKYSAVFLLDKVKDAEQIKMIKTKISDMIKEHFKGKHPGADKLCLKDGANKPDTDGYGDGMVFLSSSNLSKPRVVDQSRNDIDKGDPRIFGGVYVVGVVTLWAQDNEWGKRINASLEAVQYARTGKSFGSPPLNIDDAFDDLPEEDDAEEEEVPAPAPTPVKAPAKAKAPAKVAVEIEDESEDEAFT